MRARGFSLIELAVASAMAGVIAVSAIGAFAYLNRMLIRVEREATVSDNAKSVIDLLVTRMQGIGGGAIRPWMAVWVENGHAPDTGRDAIFARPSAVTSDRVTYAVLEPSTATCTITAMTAGTVAGESIGGVCCLQRMFQAVAGVDPEAPTQLTVFATNGELHRQVVLMAPNVTTCASAVLPGPLAQLDNVTVANSSQLTGGTLSRARIKTLYINARNELREFERFGSFPGKITLNAADTTLVSTDVFDLQLQLGYDTLADGRIVDTGRDDDEWLYNATGDDPTEFAASTLRMIGVGVVVGIRTQDTTQVHTARAAGGDVIGSRAVFMRGAQGRAALRNLFVFN